MANMAIDMQRKQSLSKLRTLVVVFAIVIALLGDVAVTPVESCARTTTTPDTVTTTTSTSTTTTTAVACPCRALRTLLLTLTEDPVGTPDAIRNGVASYPTAVDANNCATSVTCTLPTGFVPLLGFLYQGADPRTGFAPINEPYTQPVTCNKASGIWTIPDFPDPNRRLFDQFSCFSQGPACPCPKLSSLEATNTVPNEVRVPLSSMTAITYDPNTGCEASAMINCAAFGTGAQPRFRLTTPADTTVGEVNGVVSKTAECRNNGNWRTRDSTNTNVFITTFRCFYNTPAG